MTLAKAHTKFIMRPVEWDLISVIMYTHNTLNEVCLTTVQGCIQKQLRRPLKIPLFSGQIRPEFEIVVIIDLLVMDAT